MRRFHFFIDDVGHSQPLEMTVEVAGVPRARELAAEVLARSPTHVGVEVCEDGERVFGIGTFATRTHCGLKRESGRRSALRGADAGRLNIAGLVAWSRDWLAHSAAGAPRT